MSENKEFDKAMKDILGDAIEYLNCPNCKSEFVECPNCKESICPNFCEEKEAKEDES